MRAFALFFVPLLAIATASAAESSLGHVTGTVFYRERIALPETATVTVRIDDDSHADNPANTIASTTFKPNKQVPIPFDLAYSKAAIVPDHYYVLHASISVDGAIRFASTSRYPVITKGNGSRADIMVVAASASSVSLGSTAWRLVTLKGQTVAGIATDRIPYIQFDTTKKMVSGYDGCNRLTGPYQSTGTNLHFGNLARTMMACIPTTISEETFNTTLLSTTSYKIENSTLTLYHDGDAIATFGPFTP